MMIFSIVLLVVSFFLQGIMPSTIGYTNSFLSMFSTIYILITLLLIYPNFENQNKFLLLLIIFGLLVDLVYSNTLIFNTCLFYLIYKLSKTFHFLFPYNLFTINLSNLLGIYLYHIISFLSLSLLNYDNYNFIILIKSLLNSTIMTIIYSSFIYLIMFFIKQRFDLKEIK